VRDFLARRRLTDRDLDALGVLERLLGVLDRLLERRRLGLRTFLDASSSTAALGALGVRARRAERRLEALGVLDRLLDLRRFGVLDFLAFTSSSALGALGVRALRLDADRLRLLLAFGVLERRLVLREVDLLLEDLGVFDRFLDRRRLGVLDFLGASTSTAALGALGVRALRREEDRLLDAFGVLERRLLLREADRLLLDLGVLERLLARRRLGVFDFFASQSTAALGALGVLALRRELERRFEAFGVLDRRRDTERLLEAFGVLDRFLDRRRLGVRDFLVTSVVFGALGVLARRLTAFRPFDALGVLDLRRLRRRRADRERLGPLGVLERRGVRLRLAFLAGLGVASFRARFLIPISWFLFASISALYWSLSVT